MECLENGDETTDSYVHVADDYIEGELCTWSYVAVWSSYIYYATMRLACRLWLETGFADEGEGGFGFVRFPCTPPFRFKVFRLLYLFLFVLPVLAMFDSNHSISGISFICHRGLSSYCLLLTSWFSLSDKLWLDNQQPHHHRPSSLNKKSLSSNVPGSTTVINGGSIAECFMFDPVIASLIHRL